MNIAIVCPNFPPATFEGGVAHYSEHLAQHLLRRGHKIYAIASDKFKPVGPAQGNENGINIIRVPGQWNSKTIGALKRVAKEKKISVKLSKLVEIITKLINSNIF